jgi:hypothetical protein
LLSEFFLNLTGSKLDFSCSIRLMFYLINDLIEVE